MTAAGDTSLGRGPWGGLDNFYIDIAVSTATVGHFASLELFRPVNGNSGHGASNVELT